MRKATIEEGKICPNCKKQENQIKIGYNRSGTQRCRCKDCSTGYTLNPKKHEYPDVENLPSERELDELYWFVGKKGTCETRENVYLITMISRNPRLIVGFDVASDKSSERIQNIVDNSPEADFYYTD